MHTPRRVTFFIVLTGLAALVTLAYCSFSLLGSGVSPIRRFDRIISSDTTGVPGDTAHLAGTKENTSTTTSEDHFSGFGVASSIFVISLPSRQDRREQMNRLRASLGLRWTYVEAASSDSVEVDGMVRTIRRRRGFTGKPVFRWPKDINAVSLTTGPIPRSGSALWNISRSKFPVHRQTTSSSNESAVSVAHELPLTCAAGDETIPEYTPDLPHHKILTHAKVAVWESHLSVIQRIAEDTSSESNIFGDHVSVVLEDDIDMERDIRARLLDIWPLLPGGWDIVFLGEHLSHNRLLGMSQLTEIRKTTRKVIVGLMNHTTLLCCQAIAQATMNYSRRTQLVCIHPSNPNVLTHTHFHGLAHAGSSCTFSILRLHTPVPLIKRFLG
ncbi:hypothetical protein HWV62_44171 [Athelia sp. TMB]|nr:hypothetical protein HWV62_44171 [Athelia sp. TMB]